MTQTIRRAARRHRFVIVDQAAVEDTRLSWAARGLLAYLLSRPDDWKVLVNDLKRRGNLGRDGIYALLRELRSAGYVRFERHRDPQGRMRGGTYCSVAFCLELNFRLARTTFSRMSLAFAVQINGLGFLLCVPMYWSMVSINSGTLVNTPRRSC